MLIHTAAVFFAGGILNRIRGGMLSVKYARLMNAVGYGAFALYATHNGQMSHWLCFLAFATSMLIGQSLGWGRYIGALGGWEKRRLSEVAAIDWLLLPFAPKGTPRITVYDDVTLYDYEPKWLLRLWGFLALTLRGFLWGACLALPLQSAPMLVAGSTMGCAYALAGLCYRERMWEWGEFIFGGILWATVLI